ncbi:hypothetical protein IAT40_005196 [Kwoniella sp. CBS 6097]
MKFTIVSALAVLGFVSAQANIPQCVVTCSTEAAASAGCTSYTDVTCVCTNAAFQNAAGACLIANCTADEQTAAASLQQVLCAGQSVTGGSVTATISASGSSSIDASAIASLTGTDSAASSSAESLSSSAASGASASASTSASVSASASASASASSAKASGSTSGNAASSASSAAATSGGSSAASRVEVGFKGVVASLVGVAGLGLLGGAAVVL